MIYRAQIHLCNTYMYNIHLNPGLVLILVMSPKKIATVVNCFEIYSDGCQHLYSSFWQIQEHHYVDRSNTKVVSNIISTDS